MIRTGLIGAAAALFASVATVSGASVLSFDLTLRVDSVWWDEVDILDADGDTVRSFGRLDYRDDRWGLSSASPEIRPGNTIRFNGTIEDIGPTGRGGVAVSCTIGGYDCSSTEYGRVSQASSGEISIADDGDHLHEIVFTTEPGSVVEFLYADDYAGGYDFGPGDSWSAFWVNNVSRLTVIRDNRAPLAGCGETGGSDPTCSGQPPAVPLPASLPMLGGVLLVLGAFGLRRARR